MTGAISIVEVVRLTGITSRALRFYETRGLLQPLRTASGRRFFGPAELERIHQISLLKRAGLSLLQIKQLLNQQIPDLEMLLHGQLESLAGKARDIESAEKTLQTALAHIKQGGKLTTASLCQIIKESEEFASTSSAWKAVIDRYWSPHAQADWNARMQDVREQHPELTDGRYEKQWRDLSNRIEAAMPMDPAGQQAFAFLREWFALLAPITRVSTPEMRASTVAMYNDMENWPKEADAGFSQIVWNFIQEAEQAAENAGYDFRPPLHSKSINQN